MVQQSYSLCLTNSIFCPTWTDQLLNQGFWGYIISSGEGAKNHRRPTNHWDAQWYKPQVVPQGDHHPARQKHGLSQIEERRIAKYLHRLRVEVQKSWRLFGSRDGIVMGRWWKTGSIPFGSAGGFVKLRIAPDVATANERDFSFTETYADFFVFGLRMHIHTYVYELLYKSKCL